LIVVIAAGLLLFGVLFAYNLWHVYQPNSMCTTPHWWVELFVKLHLYRVTYYCL
jgi:hypothetical protein